MPDEKTTMERIQQFRQEFEATFKRPLTNEEKRILDLAEKLSRERAARLRTPPFPSPSSPRAASGMG